MLLHAVLHADYMSITCALHACNGACNYSNITQRLHYSYMLALHDHYMHVMEHVIT